MVMERQLLSQLHAPATGWIGSLDAAYQGRRRTTQRCDKDCGIWLRSSGASDIDARTHDKSEEAVSALPRG
jgi:hypothetical protein